MFTIEQIKEAHSRVKSGADFPNFIQDLIQLGVNGFETYSEDGHSTYFGHLEFTLESGPLHKSMKVSDQSDKTQFQQDLKANQDGKTDFITFCRDCAKSGIEKWVMDMSNMSCTYFDKAGDPVLAETIPIPREKSSTYYP
jgi:uncharacterized protein YbcV (DUF1398 family)